MKSIVIENSPLLEVRCSFEFEGGMESEDPKEIKNLADKLVLAYPSLKVLGISIKGEMVEGDFNASGKHLSIGLDKNKLAIRQKSLGISWNEFKELVQSIFGRYYLEVSPKSVVNVSLRYVNGFKTPDEPIHYDEFLKVHPILTEGKRDLFWVSWVQSVSILQEEIDGILTITTGTGTAIEEAPDVFLDLAMNYALVDPIEKEDIPGWLDSAHGEIKKVFLDSLTEISKKSIGYKEI